VPQIPWAPKLEKEFYQLTSEIDGNGDLQMSKDFAWATKNLDQNGIKWSIRKEKKTFKGRKRLVVCKGKYVDFKIPDKTIIVYTLWRDKNFKIKDDHRKLITPP